MPLAQFRQIGAPDQIALTTFACRRLRTAQRRVEVLLNRTSPPRSAPLLRTLATLHRILSEVQLEQLGPLCDRLHELRRTIERDVWCVTSPTIDAQQSLRLFYHELSEILREIDTAPAAVAKKSETDERFKTFLQVAAQRGWKVPQRRPAEPKSSLARKYTQQEDGIVRSCDYVQQVAVGPDQLLTLGEDFGYAQCALLLLPKQPIPENVLVEWTRPPYSQEVFVVFGYYIVLPNSYVLGLKPQLAVMENQGGPKVSTERFVQIANYLHQTTDIGFRGRQVVRHARRVRHHYYCPVLNLQPRDHRYFRRWDILLSPTKDQH